MFGTADAGGANTSERAHFARRNGGWMVNTRRGLALLHPPRLVRWEVVIRSRLLSTSPSRFVRYLAGNRAADVWSWTRSDRVGRLTLGAADPAEMQVPPGDALSRTIRPGIAFQGCVVCVGV